MAVYKGRRRNEQSSNREAHFGSSDEDKRAGITQRGANLNPNFILAGDSHGNERYFERLKDRCSGGRQIPEHLIPGSLTRELTRGRG